MNASKISVRYAKALFTSAKEKKSLDKIKDDISLIFQACNTVPEIEGFLNSPVVTPSQKIKGLSKIFENKVSDLTISFLKLVVNNKRESSLKDICRNFLDQYRSNNNIKSVVISSVKPINEKQRTQFVNFVEKEFKVKADITEVIDESLIGGFILRVGDKQYDTSISNKLKQIRNQFLEKSIK